MSHLDLLIPVTSSLDSCSNLHGLHMSHLPPPCRDLFSQNDLLKCTQIMWVVPLSPKTRPLNISYKSWIKIKIFSLACGPSRFLCPPSFSAHFGPFATHAVSEPHWPSWGLKQAMFHSSVGLYKYCFLWLACLSSRPSSSTREVSHSVHTSVQTCFLLGNLSWGPSPVNVPYCKLP